MKIFKMRNSRANFYRTSLKALVCFVLLKRCESASAQKQVILTFEYVNGTLVPVVHNATNTSTSIDTAPLIASVFLVSIFLQATPQKPHEVEQLFNPPPKKKIRQVFCGKILPLNFL